MRNAKPTGLSLSLSNGKSLVVGLQSVCLWCVVSFLGIKSWVKIIQSRPVSHGWGLIDEVYRSKERQLGPPIEAGDG